MPFFARPDLSDEQFKQLAGSQLTLSGQTRIVSTSGLTLSNGVGGNIPITAIGATGGTSIGQVMTYDGSQIKLMPSSGSGSTSMYLPPYKSPSTCTVGGLVSGTVLTGLTLSYILQQILVPAKPPVVVEPTSSFVISPSTVLYEVNSKPTITGTTTFSRGSVSPQYCGGTAYRSGVVSCYTPFKQTSDEAPIISSACSNIHSFGTVNISAGNNGLGMSICYLAGGTMYDSTGGTTFCSPNPLPSGSQYNSIVICGQYPYYYGKIASGGAAAGVNRPAPTAALITGGTKVVASSVGTISVTFGSTSDDYIWFAIPTASTSKTKWCVDALNNGNIGGAVSAGGNLFPAENSVSGVANTCWNGQTYKLYISNYQSAASTIMYLKNS